MNRTTGLKVAVGMVIIIFLIGGITALIFLGGGQTPPPNNPTTTPTTENPTPTTEETTTEETVFAGHQLPEGATVNSLDAEILSENHNSVLETRGSYTLDYEKHKYGVESEITTETLYKEGDKIYRDRNNPGFRELIWFDSEQRVTASGSVEPLYSSTQRTKYINDVSPVNMGRILKTGNFEADEVVTRDGVDYIRYKSVGGFDANDKLLEGGDISNYNARIILSQEGYIKGFFVEYKSQIDGNDFHFQLSGLYKELGSTTLEEPRWVQTALDEAPKIEAKRTNGNIELFHTGGQTINKGTEVTLNTADGTYTSTTNTDLTQGDTIYVALNGGNIEITNQKIEDADELPSGDLRVKGEYNNKRVFTSQLLD